MQPNAALSLMDRDSEDYDHASSASVNYTDEVYNKKIREINLKQAEFINKHWRKVFNLQYIMSMIIFIVVIFIVLTGLFLSYKQFEFTHEMLRKHHDAKRAIVSQGSDAISTITNTSADEKTETDISLSGSNTFEISKDGIKINSAVIGLIILAMAIAFFFLYLEFVYPIHQVQI
ncbi:hypothetical protein [Mucilaginibacter xinganensis]|nr:hypothetical protein [Mucilaginibacter xinganensis]